MSSVQRTVYGHQTDRNDETVNSHWNELGARKCKWSVPRIVHNTQTDLGDKKGKWSTNSVGYQAL